MSFNDNHNGCMTDTISLLFHICFKLGPHVWLYGDLLVSFLKITFSTRTWNVSMFDHFVNCEILLCFLEMLTIIAGISLGPYDWLGGDLFVSFLKITFFTRIYNVAMFKSFVNGEILLFFDRCSLLTMVAGIPLGPYVWL